MKGKWKRYSTPIGDNQYIHRVGRIRDLDEVEHSGNIEFLKTVGTREDIIFSNKETAEAIAGVLNFENGNI